MAGRHWRSAPTPIRSGGEVGRQRAIAPPARPIGDTVRGGGLSLLAGLRGAVLAAASGLLLWSVAPVALGWTTTVVVSGSMTPKIQVGDIVAAAPVPPREAAKLPTGVVVLVDDPAKPGRLLLHRLVDFTDDGEMITKGDANAIRDSTPVPVENLRGVARLRIPSVGLPLMWARHGDYAPVGALAVLASVLTLWRPAPD
ncbi:MAG TPA: signal peptidase I [Pilimelia sp.]|nr:signal peptidase I [Pilimelia sp.]